MHEEIYGMGVDISLAHFLITGDKTACRGCYLIDRTWTNSGSGKRDPRSEISWCI